MKGRLEKPVRGKRRFSRHKTVFGGLGQSEWGLGIDFRASSMSYVCRADPLSFFSVVQFPNIDEMTHFPVHPSANHNVLC